MPTRTEDRPGQAAGATLATNVKGLQATINFLDSDDPQAKSLVRALKDIVWEQGIQRDAYGDPQVGIKALGWSGVATKLGQHAASMRGKANAMSTTDPNRPTVEEVAGQLESLAAEIDQLGGRAIPDMLRP